MKSIFIPHLRQDTYYDVVSRCVINIGAFNFCPMPYMLDKPHEFMFNNDEDATMFKLVWSSSLASP